MALSAFDDQTRCPEPSDLRRVLGGAAALWRQLIAHMTRTYAPITEQWHFSGAKYGWSLRLTCKDRVILYLTPQAGSFRVGLALGEKAAAAARDRGRPASVLEIIDRAPRYAEGRGIRLTIAAGDDLSVLRELAALKMAPAPRSSTAPSRARAAPKKKP
jgi:hypothetical protein